MNSNKKFKRRNVLLGIIMLLILGGFITYYVREQNQIEAERIQFVAIQKLNRLLQDNLPIDYTLKVDNFGGIMQVQREEYEPIVGKKTYQFVQHCLDHQIVSRIWGKKNTGIEYIYKTENMFFQGIRVYTYVFYDGYYKDSRKYKQMPYAEVDEFTPLIPGWCRIVYREYTPPRIRLFW